MSNYKPCDQCGTESISHCRDQRLCDVCETWNKAAKQIDALTAERDWLASCLKAALESQTRLAVEVRASNRLHAEALQDVDQLRMRLKSTEGERDHSRRMLNEERKYMLAEDERRKLTGDALFAEGQLAARDVLIAKIEDDLAKAKGRVSALVSELARVSAEKEKIAADAKHDHDWWFVKSRVYGCIAAHYQAALCKIREPGAQGVTTIAAEALEWRNSENAGVPRADLDAFERLLSHDAAYTPHRRVVEALAPYRDIFKRNFPHAADALDAALGSYL